MAGRHRIVERLPVIVELKGSSDLLARAVIAVVRAADAVDRVCVGSFDLRGLQTLRVIEPAIATSAARVEVGWALLRLWCRWPLARVAYADRFRTLVSEDARRLALRNVLVHSVAAEPR